MDGEGKRFDESSGIVVKKRTSSGCLIVKKKKGAGVGGIRPCSGNRPVYEPWLENKRSRMVMSDSGSGSSDEIMLPHASTLHQTLHHHYNGFSGFDRVNAAESHFGRRRDRTELFERKKGKEGWKERKRNRSDEDEYDDDEESAEELMTMRVRRSLHGGEVDRKHGSGSSRDLVLDKRRQSHFDGSGAKGFAHQSYRSNFKVSADETEMHASLLQSNHTNNAEFDAPIRVQGKNGVLKVMINKKNKMSGLLRNFNHMGAKQIQYSPKIQETGKIRVAIQPPATSKAENFAKLHPCVRIQSDGSKTNTAFTMKCKGKDQDSEDSDISVRPQKKHMKAHTSACAGEAKALPEELMPSKIKDGKFRRGSGTEKQRLREKIRGMLLEAGWTIDYRPRRNRDYLDAVYINPTGTAYWSIIKAYEAFLKQLNNGGSEVKPNLISDEILRQLTRKTKSKAEKNLERRQLAASDSDEKNIVSIKSPALRNEETGSVYKEKRSSALDLGGGLSMKHEVDDEAGKYKSERRLYNQTKKYGRSLSRYRDRNKNNGFNRKLMVRSSDEARSLVSGKRTVLSWLLDSEVVQLSDKVSYMDESKSRVMLEGWITRDGVLCGCCNETITASKFEIHAGGSKKQQRYGNMYLESGVSLLQCQIEAWEMQREIEQIGYYAVDVNDDDPNDDTCGICGDGDDFLICCDGCPSTFHQSCLDIQMFPDGDWHCPHCTCKFCWAVDYAAASCNLLRCKMCDKKFHKSCMHDATELGVSFFCSKECKELFEELDRNVGIKHELEDGFSWCLVHRTESDPESDSESWMNNSKLAVALTVMEECFWQIIDRKSLIDIIRNVLYNCGSNFNRLNFSGFYTAILEKDDEVISSASLRFHGDGVVEMPFIGTRHVYRNRGMCRRLFNAIQSDLERLKMETVVVPATDEYRRAWIDKYGFGPVDDSLKKEMRHMNLLVFPGTDMLQKRLLRHPYPSAPFSEPRIKRKGVIGSMKTSQVDVLKSRSRPLVSASSSQTTSPLISDSAAQHAIFADLAPGGFPTWVDEQGLKTGTGDVSDLEGNGHGGSCKDNESGFETSSDEGSRRESPRQKNNNDMAFLDYIVRSPVDADTKEHNAGDPVSPARP